MNWLKKAFTSPWTKTLAVAAVSGAAQLAVSRLTRQTGASAITGGNLAAAAGAAAITAAIAHVMESPMKQEGM